MKTETVLTIHDLKVQKCVICKKQFWGYGNNPRPVKKSGVCCDECNMKKVIPARIGEHSL